VADYLSSLPIRSEADGADERVQVKIVDATNPDTQQAVVDTDSNVKVAVYGDDPTAADVALRVSELGHAAVDGIYDGTNNTDPSHVGLVAHVRDATPGDTQQTERLTSIEDSGGTVRALDVSLHDELGEAYSAVNPLPVVVSAFEGVEVHDFDQAVAVVKDATSNHDYSIASGDVFTLHKLHAAASGKMKIEVQLGDGAAVEVFSTVAVSFNSTANPECSIQFVPPVALTGTVDTTTLRVIRTNLDNQAQDLYTTLMGVTD
jgi:hypothetical protein